MTVKELIKEFHMTKEGDYYISATLDWDDVWGRFVPIMQSGGFTPLEWWFIEDSPGAWQANGIQLRHFKYKILYILYMPSLHYTICSLLNAIFCLTECHCMAGSPRYGLLEQRCLEEYFRMCTGSVFWNDLGLGFRIGQRTER